MALVDVIIGYAKGAQGDVGPQGPTGPQGPEGPQGPLPPLVNNALATTAGVAALDAVMGKTLQDQITQTNSNLALKANASDLTALAQKTLANGYAGDAGTNNYTLKGLSAYLVVCATVAANNTSNMAVYVVVTGGEFNTGVISTLVTNNNFTIVLNGWTLAITSSTYHTTAIKQL